MTSEPTVLRLEVSKVHGEDAVNVLCWMGRSIHCQLGLGQMIRP